MKESVSNPLLQIPFQLRVFDFQIRGMLERNQEGHKKSFPRQLVFSPRRQRNENSLQNHTQVGQRAQLRRRARSHALHQSRMFYRVIQKSHGKVDRSHALHQSRMCAIRQLTMKSLKKLLFYCTHLWDTLYSIIHGLLR